MGSKKLVVQNSGNIDTPQYVKVEDKDFSALAISTESVSVGMTNDTARFTMKSKGADTACFKLYNSKSSAHTNSIVRLLETTENGGQLTLVDGDGTTTVQISGDATGESFINNGRNFGIRTKNPEHTLDAAGKARVHNLIVTGEQDGAAVTISGMQPLEEAPADGEFKQLYIDINSGIVYYQ